MAHIRFAHAPGVVQTLEGPVSHGSGAAVVTGGAGEPWPVERARFEETYEAIAPTCMGEDGAYRHVSRVGWARRSTNPSSLSLSKILTRAMGSRSSQVATSVWLTPSLRAT